MISGLTPGATASLTIDITRELTVNALPLPEAPTFPLVFATGYLVAFAEMACHTILKPYLEEGEGSVGIEVNFTHTAATPVGLTATADATLTAIDGRIAEFEVVLRDDVEEIGRGTHRRAVIQRERFDAKAAAKASRSA